MSRLPDIVVTEHIWAELAEDDRTPPPVLGDMSAWVSQYTFPYWQTEWEERCLTLERRGRVGEDRWALMDRPSCYNKRTGKWDYENSPSNRSDQLLRDCRMTLAEARPIIARQVYRLHSHALRRVARMVAIREMRQAETKAAEEARETE